jgi:hypothetical protein
MSRFNQMSELLKSVFTNVDKVWQLVKEGKASVCDYKNDGSFVVQYDEDGLPFVMINERQFSIEFCYDSNTFVIDLGGQFCVVPIDGRYGLLGFGKSYCDFVFFDETSFCFVETKLEASSLSESAVKKNRIKALKQLEDTINFFDTKLENNYVNLVLEAYVSTPPIYPRNNLNWLAMAEDFLENIGVEVYETNIKSIQY